MTKRGGIGDVVDELLALPPEQFTEARNAAAKRLAAAGQRDEAADVKRLPRPPLALWALNRLAHEQPALLEAFLRAAAELRTAHHGGGDIRAATKPERDAEARVVAAAGELVRAQGKKPTDTVVSGIRETLRAAAADAGVAAELRSGRLTREPEAPSLDDLLGSLPQRSAARAPNESEHSARRVALREKIAEAKTDASEAKADARSAAKAADDARRESERTRTLAERAQDRADAAAEHVADLQRRLDELA
jgi:hypothetical protein